MTELPTKTLALRHRLILEDRLRRIDARLKAIPGELKALSEQSDAYRQRQGELGDLEVDRRVTSNKLAELKKPAKIDPRLVASIKHSLERAEQDYARSQEQWRDRGDERQARLYRMQHLGIRERIEREIGDLPL